MSSRADDDELKGKIIRHVNGGEPLFEIGTFINKGAFGRLYRGRSLKTNDQVAIKFESQAVDKPQLQLEFKFYKLIGDYPGIPHIHYFGPFQSWHILAMDMLGPSLESKFVDCGRKFSLKTTLQLSFQIMDIIYFVHHFGGVIVRDLKPENFLLGLAAKQHHKRVHLIDLGLAKEFRPNGQHIAFAEDKPILGTIRYMSINAQEGKEQSRRDDLESIAYILLYFLRGALPWQNLRAPTTAVKFERIKYVKKNTPIEMLCAGQPAEIKKFLETIRGLWFDETPPYQSLKDLLKKVFADKKFKDDDKFDWEGNGQPDYRALIKERSRSQSPGSNDRVGQRSPQTPSPEED